MYYNLCSVINKINDEYLFNHGAITLAFQFISINELAGSELIRWTVALDNNILTSYRKSAKEFTKEEETQEQDVKRTLVDKDWFLAPYIYDFNNNQEYKDYQYNRENGYVGYDNNDLILLKKMPIESNYNNDHILELTQEWFNCLKSNFKFQTSYLWIPQPHISKLTDQKIFNAAFLVFSKNISEQIKYPISKLIRDFIIQHIIDLVILKTLKSKYHSSDFRALKYNAKENSQLIVNLDNLYKRYFESETHLTDFIEQMGLALKYMARLKRDGFKKNEDSKHRNFPNLKDITPNREKDFCSFLFGRFCVLGLHLIFGKTLNETYHLLTGTVAVNPRKYISDKFSIEGLETETGDYIGTNFYDVIPYISIAELDFLNELCEQYQDAPKKQKIKVARVSPE